MPGACSSASLGRTSEPTRLKPLETAKGKLISTLTKSKAIHMHQSRSLNRDTDAAGTWSLSMLEIPQRYLPYVAHVLCYAICSLSNNKMKQNDSRIEQNLTTAADRVSFDQRLLTSTLWLDCKLTHIAIMKLNPALAINLTFNLKATCISAASNCILPP